MSKNIQAKNDGEKQFLEKIFKEDGWMNILTGIGTRARDKRERTTFSRKARLDSGTLEDMFHQDDLTGTICELPAREMTRQWVTLNVPQKDEDEKDPSSDVMATLDDLGFRKKCREAITWARLHGGSCILLGADDGSENAADPLNEENIQSFEWMTVLDRWEIQVSTYYDDPSHPKYGEPEKYMLTNSIAMGSDISERVRQQFKHNIVHESRLLRFDGALTSRRRRQENSGWSESVIEKMRDTIRDFNSGFASVANLLQDYAQAVFKIKGLAEMLAHDNDKLVLRRLQILDMARSVGRAIPLDADSEDFERTATPTAGLEDILDRFMMRMSSAARMPVTLLFGRSPAGMNATGESDIRLFYDSIGADQEDNLRGPIEYVIRLMFKAKQGPTGGEEPDSWSIEFNPLWQESAKEKAETRDIVADTDKKYVDMGAVDPAEIRNSRWGGDKYSPEMKIVTVEGDEGGETLATVNELSLTIERAARVGDIAMVNAARRSLAKRLGMTEVPDVTIEQLGQTLQVLRAREAEGVAEGGSAGRADNPYSVQRRGDKWVVVKDKDGKVMGTHETEEKAQRQLAALEASERSDHSFFPKASGRHNAPGYTMAPELLAQPSVTLEDLDGADFKVCDNCGWENKGVCTLFRFTVDPDHVCKVWTDPADIPEGAILDSEDDE